MAFVDSAPIWGVFITVLVLESLLLINLIKFRSFVLTMFSDWTVPERREAMWKEIAHGVMRAASERSGALKGATSRQAEAALTSDVSGLAISGLASFLPKKYQAFAPLIAPYIQQFLQNMPQAQAQAQGNSGGGLP